MQAREADPDREGCERQHPHHQGLRHLPEAPHRQFRRRTMDGRRPGLLQRDLRQRRPDRRHGRSRPPRR
ncbi:hypothetical protein QJS04_geneDACA004598 [Acorus gramineus]|uniref:Protamine-2 n=1 Tax=Acorus gramineus TaxID=55184 RepID=A0AAV9BVD5_ACOGR|nr:hypothetical protein QJS04_geneDACA004598 [Acorus gramineus]